MLWKEDSGKQKDNVPGDSCSFSGIGQRKKGRSSSLASHSKAQHTDGEQQKSSLGSDSEQERILDKSGIPCRFRFC